MGLPKINFHAFRHTYASIRIHDLGDPIANVSKDLGHSSIQITVDTYGHADDGRASIKSMDERFKWC